MDKLIQKIDEKNNWGKNELGQLLADTCTRYNNMVMKKPLGLNDPENTKENIVSNTCMFVLTQIQSKTSWGKTVVKEMIFKKLVEEISC